MMRKNPNAIAARRPSATATPIPAFAPDERPVVTSWEPGAAEAVEVLVLVEVGVEVEEEVSVEDVLDEVVVVKRLTSFDRNSMYIGCPHMVIEPET